MNIDRLRKIIEYSEKNRTQMDSKVAKFYSFTGISEDKDMLNILQIVRPALRQRGYIVLEIPFADEEIGALCYHGDALGYILINTSLSRVNANFAICHEIYHAFYPQNEFKAKAEFADDYFEHEEEYEANIFAGMLATVYKGNIIKDLIMDCQSYTKYRPNETTGGIFVSWRRKEELPTGA